MDLYAENILDHYRHPRLKGNLSSPHLAHTESNISCGDELTLHLRVNADRVVTIAWTGSGCAISQAAMSMLAEEIAGKTIEELAALTPKTMFDLLGVPISNRRLKCALLALHTLKNVLHMRSGQPAQGWHETIRAD